MARKDKGTKRPWSFTPEQEQFVRVEYKRLTLSGLTEAFREAFGPIKTKDQIRSYTRNHGILSGRSGCFERGHKPWNTGTKGLVKPNSGNFKKGGIPANRKRLWHERLSRDGYILISVPETNPHTGYHRRYREKHVWLWEGENGPVPEGHALVFKDGNKTNCCMDNLILVSRSELLSLNLHRYKDAPDELKPSILALARMEAKGGIRTRPGRSKDRRLNNEFQCV